MRMKLRLVAEAEADDLPVTYSWGEAGPPEDVTAEEAQLILLFEIADALKMMAYPGG